MFLNSWRVVKYFFGTIERRYSRKSFIGCQNDLFFHDGLQNVRNSFCELSEVDCVSSKAALELPFFFFFHAGNCEFARNPSVGGTETCGASRNPVVYASRNLQVAKMALRVILDDLWIGRNGLRVIKVRPPKGNLEWGKNK